MFRCLALCLLLLLPLQWSWALASSSSPQACACGSVSYTHLDVYKRQLKRRKKGRSTVAGVPSRFIAEMKLHEAQAQEDPRARLKKLRDAMAAKVAACLLYTSRCV